jgi:hypothetical protein
MAYHPHNGWHDFLISREAFDGAAWLSIMGSNCTEIINPKLFKYYVRAASIAMKGQKMDAIRYEQFGWKDNFNAFLVGNSLIRRGGATEYAYGDEALEPRQRAMRVPKNASRQAWSIAGNNLFRPGFEAMGFGLITSFAAPLLSLVAGATDGGAVLALHTQGSGFGKTNTLQAAASVWGVFDALSVSGADTENAKFNIITKACHLVVLEEEMGNNDPHKESASLKRFVGGKDKNRSDRTGVVAYKNDRFQTFMISASNHSLADIIRTSSDQGAMARIFEISVPAPTDKEAFKEFSKITGAMLDNCGIAGREFIHAIMSTPGMFEWVKASLDTLVTHYQTLLETAARDRYIVYLMACNHMAALILNAIGLLSFDTKRIMEWALEFARARAENLEGQRPIELINEFIAEAIMDCLVVESAFLPRKPAQVTRYPSHRLVMRLEKDTGTLYISQQVLREWLRKTGYHAGTLAQELQKAGVLRSKNKQVTLAAGTDYPGSRVFVWEINMNHPEINGMPQLVAPANDDEKPATAAL